MVCATVIVISIVITVITTLCVWQDRANTHTVCVTHARSNTVPAFTSRSFALPSAQTVTLQLLQRTSSNIYWTYEGVRAVMGMVKADGPFLSADHDNACLLMSLASNAHFDMPTTAIELLLLLYSLPVTSDGSGSDVLDIINRTTNECLAPYLVQGYTMFTDRAARETNAVLQSLYNRKAFASRLAIKHLDSPYASHLLNMYYTQRRDEYGEVCEPCATFSPDRHPREARDWLLCHPELSVREAMAECWIKSQRPETVHVMREYIAQLKAIPTMDAYWTNGWRKEEHRYIKAITIRRWENLVDAFERAYARWIEDGKRQPLHSGYYNDDNWHIYLEQTGKRRQE